MNSDYNYIFYDFYLKSTQVHLWGAVVLFWVGYEGVVRLFVGCTS